MVFLNWDALPWYWHGFDHFAFAMLMVALVPGLLAFVFGWLAFRSRVTGVYLSIMTQALTYALMLAFFRNEMGFGGNNGLTDFKDLLGANLQADSTRAALFVASAAALALAYMFCRAVVRSKLGRVMTAMRDAEDRTRFVGYRVERFQLAVFTARQCLRESPGLSTCRKSASSIPASFSRSIPSSWWSGWRSAAAARCTAPPSARWSSTTRRPR